MDISNIDDMLASGKVEAVPVEENALEVMEEPVSDSSDPYGIDKNEDVSQASDESDESDEGDNEEKELKSFDEYGNESPTEGMKKRLKKQADNIHNQYKSEIESLRAEIAKLTPQQQQTIRQEAENFEVNPNSDDSWEDQLNSHIERTVMNMHSKREREARDAEERQLNEEFRLKIVSGLERFHDFKETIDSLPCTISDEMTLATRTLDDPAAFLYAAAKRHPTELERISKLKDPYAQVREMGNLEARMRKQKAATQAPRPLGRTLEDVSHPQPKQKKEETIEELIAKNDAKKLARVNQRRR